MSTPISADITGTFESDGFVRNITLPSGYTKFEMFNITDIGSSAANTNVMRAIGTSDMALGSALVANKTSGATTIALWNTILTNGFNFVEDSASVLLGAANSTISAISAADPALVALGSTTGLSNFDVIRVFDTTGMLQIGGWDFTIDSVVTDITLELAFLDSSGFTAPATAGTLRRVPFDPRYYPVNRRITAIGPGLPTGSSDIQLSVTHGFTIGQQVRIKVPPSFGMVEMDGLSATITGEDLASNLIIVDIDSSSFTPFAFPSSAEAAAGVEAPQVIPIGESTIPFSANLLDDATRNVSFRGVQVGTSVQTGGVTYQWIATRGVNI